MVSERRRYPRRTFIFLVAAGTLTGPLVIPYFLGLEAIAPGAQLSGLYQNLMFLVPGAAIGLLVAPKLGLGAPYLESWLDGAFDRLFLLSLLAWLGMKLFRVSAKGRGRWIALWIANLGTALFFGWYHISNEALFVDPVPLIVGLRTVLIVLPAGLAFGWIYIRRGLEAAILSHFIIDVIVHVVRPIIQYGLVT